MTTNTTLYLPPEDKARLIRLAAWESISMSELIRRILYAEYERVVAQYPKGETQ